jgi:hypothetical protein
MGPGRSAQAGRPSPIQVPFDPSFDLAANRAIYSPGVLRELRRGLPCKVPTSVRETLVNYLDPLLSGMVSLSSLLLGGR